MLMSQVFNNASQDVVTDLHVALCSRVANVSNGDDKPRPITSGKVTSGYLRYLTDSIYDIMKLK